MPVHTDIFSYSPSHVESAIAPKELAPQIYGFRLFTPEFCKKLLEEADACGKWEEEEKIDFYMPRIHAGPFDCVPEKAKLYACRFNEKESDTSCDADQEAKSGLSLKSMPGLNEVFGEVVDRHVFPLARDLWPTYRPRMKRTPYILRYDAEDDSLPEDMEVHWDQNVLAMVVYLNDEFDGGGTVFPRWGVEAGKNGPGWAVFYPGGVSHEHGGGTITRGRRFVLVCDFY